MRDWKALVQQIEKSEIPLKLNEIQQVILFVYYFTHSILITFVFTRSFHFDYTVFPQSTDLPLGPYQICCLEKIVLSKILKFTAPNS